jgi:hypothetical protein
LRRKVLGFKSKLDFNLNLKEKFKRQEILAELFKVMWFFNGSWDFECFGFILYFSMIFHLKPVLVRRDGYQARFMIEMARFYMIFMMMLNVIRLISPIFQII